MASISDPQKPKIVVAVQSEPLRDRLRRILGPSLLELEFVRPTKDPLENPPETSADLLLVRRSEMSARDLRLIDEFTSETENPGLVVLRERGSDIDRARMFAAGASSVLETDDTNRDLLENLEALAEAESQGGSRGPHSGGPEPEPRLADFLSRSPVMQRFLDLVQRVVETDSSLLLTGETGVGKERLAQAIHNEGARAEGPFISVNCGAIPEQLLESELFGHTAGAFTGADHRKKGRFEVADGGTIFLDEIGEMAPQLQVRLLTVLHRRRVQSVGSEDAVPVDVRVMAATNRDIRDQILAGRFRKDLYYRLNVVTLEIPPLRERLEDVPELAGRFISHFRAALGRREVESLSDEALSAMLDYHWPGNVRELVNAIEHAIVLCTGPRITLADLPETVTARAAPLETAPIRSSPTPVEFRPGASSIHRPLREARRLASLEFEREYLIAALTKSRGRIKETAAAAGITPRSLYDKMKAHGLRKEDFR